MPDLFLYAGDASPSNVILSDPTTRILTTINASLNQTLDDFSLASSSAVAVNGSLSAALSDIALSSSAAVVVSPSLLQTLDDLSLSASAGILIGASLAATLDGLSLSAAGSVPVNASASLALGELLLSASTKIDITSQIAEMLDSLILSSSGIVDIRSSLAQLLDLISLDASVDTGGAAIVHASLDQSLDDVTLDASAQITGHGQAAISSPGGGYWASVAKILAERKRKSEELSEILCTCEQRFDDLSVSAAAKIIKVIERKQRKDDSPAVLAALRVLHAEELRSQIAEEDEDLAAILASLEMIEEAA